MHSAPLTRLASTCALALGCQTGGMPSPQGESTTDGSADASTGSSTTTAASGPDTSTAEATTASESSESSSSGSETGPSPVVCGDGVVEGNEECEDGNREPDDGCDLACNHSGVLSWALEWDGPAGSSDGARGLAVGPDGTLAVVGFEAAIGTGTDAFVSLREPDGDEIWRRTYDASGEHDEATRVVFDASGGIVVIGSTTTADLTSLWIRRHDGDGDESWTLVDAGPDGVGAEGYDLAVAPGDVLYAAADWERAAGTIDAGVLAIDGQLGVVTDTWEFPAVEGNAHAQAIAFDGEVVLVTTESSPGEATNTLLRRLDANGSPLWSVIENGEGEFTDEHANAVRIAEGGDIVVVGRIDREGQGSEVWTARYDASGVPLWSRTFHRSPDSDEFAQD